ncbi:MAG: hypothetical protein ACXVB9_12925 [Bdellovibrionota bacterium]
MSKNLVLLFLAFTLAACGTPKKSADNNSDPGIGGTDQGQHAGGDNPNVNNGDCAAKSPNAFISSDGKMCLVPTTVSIPDNTRVGRVLVDGNFHEGKFLVSSGTNSAVVLLFNGHRIALANFRGLIGSGGSGQLVFQILDPTHSQTTATTWECLDGNMHAVFCNDGVIP